MGKKIHNEDEIWMSKALELAKAALEKGEFPVGCILVSQGQVVGEGGRMNSSGNMSNELDHAEILALRQWVERGKPGHGDVVAYSTLEPCLMCTGALVISGVKKIVFAYEDVMGGACGLDFSGGLSACSFQEDLQSLYGEAAPEVVPGVLRKESLRLFKSFFSKPDNLYLKNTILEQYTLRQELDNEE